jgi:hypothetical protein
MLILLGIKIIYRGINSLADDLLYVCQLHFVSFRFFIFRFVSLYFVSFRFVFVSQFSSTRKSAPEYDDFLKVFTWLIGFPYQLSIISALIRKYIANFM